MTWKIKFGTTLRGQRASMNRVFSLPSIEHANGRSVPDWRVGSGGELSFLFWSRGVPQIESRLRLGCDGRRGFIFLPGGSIFKVLYTTTCAAGWNSWRENAPGFPVPAGLSATEMKQPHPNGRERGLK